MNVVMPTAGTSGVGFVRVTINSTLAAGWDYMDMSEFGVYTDPPAVTPTPTPTPTATPTPPPRDTTPAPTPVPWASLRPPSHKLATGRKFVDGKLQMTAYCSQFDNATVTLTISKKLAKKLKLKSRVIATGTGDCDRHNRLVTKLKPTKAAENAFLNYKKKVNATATLTTNGLDHELTVTRKIKLAKKGKKS
jgi:hypothetical protein